MKLKVIRKYNDRYTKERRKAGDVIDVNDDRAKDLIAQGFAEKYTPAKKASDEEKG